MSDFARTGYEVGCSLDVGLLDPNRLMAPVIHRFVGRVIEYAGIFILLSALGLAFWRPNIRKVAAATTTPTLSQPDTICRSCHQQIYDHYQQTPMAKASGLAANGLDATQLAAKNLFQRSSGVTYRIFLRDGQPYLSYSRPASDERWALDGEHRLDFFIGSGHRGRTYLYQESGLWFEAPINWYGKARQWDMAPAFEDAASMPDPLPVDPNCLHCHAGEVQPAVGPARNRFATQPFRSGGIGCSACHGDPTAHVARTLHQTFAQMRVASKGSPPESVSPPIVNPAALDPVRRDSICLQCHLEGDAAVYLPGKSLQTFQPGEELSASVTYFIDRNRSDLGLRATSQYEALLRSACKRAAGDRLTCTTCHDPHNSPSPAERVAFFRTRCLSCHTGELMASRHHPEQQDCAVCHMRTRKTADISHEQLTDHDIEAKPKAVTYQSVSLLAKSQSTELVPIGTTTVKDRELGLAYAQLAQRGDRESGRKALTILLRAERAGSTDPEVLDQLGFLLQISGLDKSAAEHYLAALRQNPQDIIASANLAVVDASSGQTSEAIRLLSEVVHANPSQTSAGLNLAFLECRAGRKADAVAVLQTMLKYNSDSLPAHGFFNTGNYGNQHCDLR